MENTYLIQRLKRPFPQFKTAQGELMQKLTEGFSFGGGLRNGGLSKDVMSLLRPIFRFDYMGAAEFEWGAVQKALEKIYEERRKYTVGSLCIGDECDDHHIYYLCNKDDEIEIRERIKKLAKNSREFRLKCWCGLKENLEGEKYIQDTVGWIELDNAFMFFTDNEMAEKAFNLFWINTEK